MRNPAYAQWLPAPSLVRVTLIARRLAPPAPVDIQHTSVSDLRGAWRVFASEVGFERRCPTAFTLGGGPGGRAVGSLTLCSDDRYEDPGTQLETAAVDRVPERGKPRSISDPQQVFPLAQLPFEAHALGDRGRSR